MVPLTTESTTFTRDAIGRYTCNTFGEAIRSTDRSRFPDARPFDFVILGGGTFGSVLACRLFGADRSHAHRVLVLEAGPMLFTEHVQNQPTLTTDEVWGVPWNSDSPQIWNQRFPGLAFCIGGRSLYWGGWSPSFVPTELVPPWPETVVRDLTEPLLKEPDGRGISYLDMAASQIGSDTPNDFVFGPLHDAMRKRLFNGLRDRRDDVATRLVGQLGTPMSSPGDPDELIRQLEAPLAVQSQSPRPGFFPMNKFSAAQLLIRAARQAQTEAEQSTRAGAEERDVKKRLMIVPNAHVIRLERLDSRIVRIHTNQGSLDVPDNGQVFLALGTVESTRLALLSVPNSRGLVGRNLMAHLRSNLTLRIRRSTLAELASLRELAVSALFVKGIHRLDDGTYGHFHVQITASGVGGSSKDSEAELFKKIPDIDTLEHFKSLTDEWVVITLRGIGEMMGDRASDTPRSRIALGGSQGVYDYGEQRATVRLDPSERDLGLWDEMDKSCDEIARILADGTPIQYLSAPGSSWQDFPPGPDQRRDTLSSTHHEGGTLWMGDDPTTSVTDVYGKFHETENLYAVGPALLPRMGSPNPMLSGVALARRLADRLATPAAQPEDPGFTALFDGTEGTYSRWQSVGRGAFRLLDGAIVAEPGDDLGLLYYVPQTFEDFVLRLEVKLEQHEDNSGIFVRFRDPRKPVPDPIDPTKLHGYQNPAWVPVRTGFEIQIDDLARPDGIDMHRTGAIYGIPTDRSPNAQKFIRQPDLEPGRWCRVEIKVEHQTYAVRIEGKPTTAYVNTDRALGVAPSEDTGSGFIGLQAHTGRLAFRAVQIRELGRAAKPKDERVERRPREGALAGR